MTSLNADQCNQLIAMLSAHFTSSIQSTSIGEVHSASFETGVCADEHNRFLSSNLASSTWIVESGASRHICAYRSLFTDLEPLHNSTVTTKSCNHPGFIFWRYYLQCSFGFKKCFICSGLQVQSHLHRFSHPQFTFCCFIFGC